jgi:hypothetical protein
MQVLSLALALCILKKQKSRFRPRWKHNHGLDMGGTSGDHERGVLDPSCHCLVPGGGVFLPSHNKIHDTHTSLHTSLVQCLDFCFVPKYSKNTAKIR